MIPWPSWLIWLKTHFSRLVKYPTKILKFVMKTIIAKYFPNIFIFWTEMNEARMHRSVCTPGVQLCIAHTAPRYLIKIWKGKQQTKVYIVWIKYSKKYSSPKCITLILNTLRRVTQCSNCPLSQAGLFRSAYLKIFRMPNLAVVAVVLPHAAIYKENRIYSQESVLSA